MQNRRERRKLLRQFGLLKSDKKFSHFSSIEAGNEIHRQNLQAMKNQQIINQKNETPNSIEDNEIFTYRNESNEYGSFQSMMLSKDWDKIENS